MKKKSLMLIAVVLLLVATTVLGLVGCDLKAKGGEAVKVSDIKLASDGMIRVLQLTDLHLTKGSSKKEDKETLRWIAQAVDYARPDVVAITGDAVGGAYGRDNALIELANLLEKKKVYWMYTMGNHDGEWSTATKEQVGHNTDESVLEGRLELLELLKGYEYSLMQRGDTDGVGNYLVNFVDDKNQVVHSMINMDTHGKKYEEVDGELKDVGYQGLKPGQVTWYTEQLNSLKARTADNSIPKSTLFMHVPVVEYRSAWNSLPHVGGFPAINLERNVYAPSDEDDIAFCEVVDRIGSTQFMTVGHDHDFNWLRDYRVSSDSKGIYLSYGRVSGVNAWGRRAPIGATVIDINPKAMSKEGMYKVSVIEPTFDYSKWEGENW